MRRPLIALPILALTAGGIAAPARALPTMPPRDSAASLPSPALLSVRYYRYWHHRHHWRALSRAVGEGGGIKTGQWQFTSALLAPAAASGMPSSASPSRPAPGPPADSGAKTTYMACITSDKAIPAGIDPRCKLDGTQRQGSRISWSMSCANTHARSDGVAQYHGDTMDGTMISHLRGTNGPADMTQHITGRYVGPCTQTAQTQMPPAEMVQPTNQAGSSQPQAEQPGSTPDTATAPQAGGENAAGAEPPERHARHHAHYRHYVRHRYRRHYWRWY